MCNPVTFLLCFSWIDKCNDFWVDCPTHACIEASKESSSSSFHRLSSLYTWRTPNACQGAPPSHLLLHFVRRQPNAPSSCTNDELSQFWDKKEFKNKLKILRSLLYFLIILNSFAGDKIHIKNNTLDKIASMLTWCPFDDNQAKRKLPFSNTLTCKIAT